MDTVIRIIILGFSGLYIVLALGLLLGFYRTRHPGMLPMAVTYIAAAGAALGYMHWWPLVVGLVITWVLRLMGLEPHVEREP